MRLTNLVLILTAAISVPAMASIPSAWDSSGNSKLSGTYYFRQIVYQGVDSSGTAEESTALYGTITFDGSGNYTLTGMMSDSLTSSGTPESYPTSGTLSGTYGIASSGLGWIESPLFTSDTIIGSVSKNGVFLGSSTEGSSNDVFVAVPAPSTTATVANFSGKYWLAYGKVPGSTASASDAMFSVTADGSGNISSSVTATGYSGTSSTVLTQTISSLTYSFSSGVGTLAFPSSGTLISGSMIFYISSDGNVIVGGSASGYDILVGLKAISGTAADSAYSGLYYTAGFDIDNRASSTPYFDTYYGAYRSTGTGTILADDRLAYSDSAAFDETYDTGYSLNTDGTYATTWYSYAVGLSGMGFVSIGKGPILSVNLGLLAPDMSGSGVYLDPTWVVNAASWAPFIGGVAPGEFITLAGTDLSSSTAIGTIPYGTTLNNTQVLINGRAAPIYYASPTQLNVIVPWATETASTDSSLTCDCLKIQVVNNGTYSNTVTVFADDAAPGFFSLTANGVGYAAMYHTDYSLVTSSNPATAGETLMLFGTGLGAVSTSVSDGYAPGAVDTTSNTFYVYIDSTKADTNYVGLQPTYPGLYQINAVVPSSVSSGDVYLDIWSYTNGFYASQVMIPVK